MGQPAWRNPGVHKWMEPGEVKHLSSRRKRNRRDSLSSGERKGNSLNRWHVRLRSLCCRGCGNPHVSPQADVGVTKLLSSRTVLGKQAIEGDSPVGDR
jgi:hypothetical protein